MSVARMPSIYETPRECPGCGHDFLPPRRPDGRILEHCSTDCRKAVARRVMAAGSPFEGLAAALSRSVKPATPPVARAPRPLPTRVKYPEAIPAYGRTIAALRLARGWLQQDLADAIGVHRRSVAGWELGQSQPPISKFAAMAAAFGTTLDALYHGETGR